jgi:hypothetical protein
MITNVVADFCERTLFLFTGVLILRTFNYLFFLSFQDISWSEQATRPPIIRSRDQYRRLPSGSTSTCKYSLNISGLTLHFRRYCLPQVVFSVESVCRRHQKYLKYDVWFVPASVHVLKWSDRPLYLSNFALLFKWWGQSFVRWQWNIYIFSACTQWGYSDVNFYSLWIYIIMNNEMCFLKSAWFALKSQEGPRC